MRGNGKDFGICLIPALRRVTRLNSFLENM